MNKIGLKIRDFDRLNGLKSVAYCCHLINVAHYMLHLIQSNKMECLADSLIHVLDQTSEQGHSAFESDVILVQSPGMSQWLKIQIAEKLGIAANIDFPLPSSFIWRLYQQHIDGLPEQSAFTKANMTWKLMAILPQLLERAEFLAIKQYLTDASPLKLYQLACKIADVYDQYLVYRPEWILAWENGENILPDIDEKAHPWQAILWRELVQKTTELSESAFHRANLHQSLLNVLHQPDESRKHHDTKPLLVFGISAMPLQQLEVLNALAQNRDIVIFWFNPSQHYWGDIIDSKTQAKAQLKATNSNQEDAAALLDLGNPLLASWGKLGRDYQDMLLQFELQQQDCFVEESPQTLLEHIQSDINLLQYRATQTPLEAAELLSNGHDSPKIEIAKGDESLQVHACHSKVRELEVLHDQLLACFNQHPDWHPGDVIVMMPDVASYAPFIEGVFGAVDSDLAIPFAISDRNLGQMSQLISSFMQLMKLHQSRLTLSEVLSLLEVPAIQRQFDISLQEYELLQHWLTDAGVRWGWDQQDKERWDLPGESQNTWVFGLRRLLAGYAMSSHAVYQSQVQNIVAYQDIEGQQAVALGKCYQFTEVLMATLTFCQQAQPLADKVEQALDLIDKLYNIEEAEHAEWVMLRETLESLLNHQAQYQGDVDQDVFVSELAQNIQDKGVGQRFLAGYVNFCTLMPMRSIPFKMVCLLGLNETDYPRQSVPMGFDLMRLAPSKRGDRSRRLDDRYLFLEALLSARDLLYFSYQGFNQKDNSPLAPSILLSELLEYCHQGFSLRGELELPVEQTENNLIQHLITEHKLQAFHQSYFLSTDEAQNNLGASSFSRHQKAIAEQRLQQVQLNAFEQGNLSDLTLDESQDRQVDLERLVQLFQNPAKAFFINRWQTRFLPLNQQSLNEEPFGFDGLDRYQLNERLVAQHLTKILLPESAADLDLHSVLRGEGSLPVGETGSLALTPLIKQSNQLAKQVANVIQSQTDDTQRFVEINLECANISLVGQTHQLYGQNLVLWRPGKIRAKDRLQLYLYWLALCAAPPATGLNQACFVSIETGGVIKTYTLPKVEVEIAKDSLNTWLNHFAKGQNNILHFYPESAWNWVKNQDQNKLIQVFVGNDFSAGEGNEPHIQRVCPDLSAHMAPFTELSETLFMPLLLLGES